MDQKVTERTIELYQTRSMTGLIKLCTSLGQLYFNGGGMIYGKYLDFSRKLSNSPKSMQSTPKTFITHASKQHPNPIRAP